MNRRDAFRTALAAAVAAMMPPPAAPVDEIAKIFGVPAKLLPTATRHPWFLLDDNEFFAIPLTGIGTRGFGEKRFARR